MTSRPTRHQLRRQARRLRRDGFQPMMVFSQGDQLPETARRSHRPRLVAVPLRTRTHRPRAPHRGRRPDAAPLSSRSMAVAGPWHGGEHGDSSPPCACLAAEGMVGHRPACRTHLRQCRDRGHGRMADRRDRTRPGHGTDARPRGRSHPDLRAPVVGQSSAPRQGPRGAHARIVAGDRDGHRSGRIAGHVRHGGRVGLAGPLPPGARPDHPRRDREDPGHRVGPGHLPGRRPRPPDARRPGQPVRAARARHRPARRRHHLARPVRRRRSPSRSTSARSRTPRRAACCSCAGTAWPAERPGRARAAGSTCSWATWWPAATWSSGPST